MNGTSALVVSIGSTEKDIRGKAMGDGERSMVQLIEDMVESAVERSEKSVRRAAEEIGLCVVTQKQFAVMQWGAKQLKIRRLQSECDHILSEME